jgi:hypothetical protein
MSHSRSGDAGVGAALGHQRHHFALPWASWARGVMHAAGTEENGDNLGIEGRTRRSRPAGARRGNPRRRRPGLERTVEVPAGDELDRLPALDVLARITIARSGIRARRSCATRAPSLVGYWDPFPPHRSRHVVPVSASIWRPLESPNRATPANDICSANSPTPPDDSTIKTRWPDLMCLRRAVPGRAKAGWVPPRARRSGPRVCARPCLGARMRTRQRSRRRSLTPRHPSETRSRFLADRLNRSPEHPYREHEPLARMMQRFPAGEYPSLVEMRTEYILKPGYDFATWSTLGSA